MAEFIAHRGNFGKARENTLEAFLSCKDHGVYGVELDVRRSADGALVVFHDPEIAGLGQISELDLVELPEWLPRLDEVLDIAPPMFVNIEIKNDPRELCYDESGELSHNVCTTIQMRPGLKCLVSSFDIATIDCVKSEYPEVNTGFLSYISGDEVLDIVVSHGHNSVNLHYGNIDLATILKAHELGIDVFAWTVDDPKGVEEMIGMGVDYIITNKVEDCLSRY